MLRRLIMINLFCFYCLSGPLTYKENGKSYLFGVVSWGGSHRQEQPDVYARVTSALDWIHKELRSSC